MRRLTLLPSFMPLARHAPCDMRLLGTIGTLAMLAAPIAAHAQSTSAAPAGGRAIVSGTVFDSVARAPLAGAQVQLTNARRPSDAPRVATTDASGVFRFNDLTAGALVVSFLHLRLDSLGIEAPVRLVTVSESAPAHVELAIPSTSTLSAKFCPAMPRSDSAGVLVGLVRDLETAMPLDGATVLVRWREAVLDGARPREEQLESRTTTTAEGRYVLCSVPSDVQVGAWVRRGADSTGLVEVRVQTMGLAIADFDLAARAAPAEQNAPTVAQPRGTARINGTVRTANGRAVANAQVRLWNGSAGTTTDAKGEFRLVDLPAGTQSVEVRALGFAPRHASVSLRAGVASELAITLDERADVLSTVRVRGRKTDTLPSVNMAGFERRRKSALGRFLTRDEITSRHASSLTDVLRTFGSIHVMNTGEWEQAITMRGTGTGSCTPTIWIDGMRVAVDLRESRSTRTIPLTLAAETMDREKWPAGGGATNNFPPPRDVAGVEVYESAAQLPAEFGGYHGCAIVIWTVQPPTRSKQPPR